MIIHELPGNILYIENVFPKAQDFIDSIEAIDSNPESHSVIPAWQDWYDSTPVQHEGEDNTKWDRVLDNYTKGKQKLFDWDRSISNYNTVWPKPNYVFDDEAHRLAKPIIDLINEPYLEILDIWSKKNYNNKKLDYVSKNYFLRKYHVGGAIGSHIDKNINNPLNTMDWSVLFYLNDKYKGGEIIFPELDIKIKPSAGSAIFFPCTAVHIAEPVTSGEKYYIFMVIHSEFGYSSGLGEEYHTLNELILEYNGVKDHPLLEIAKNRKIADEK